jgi:hypothetical protein
MPYVVTSNSILQVVIKGRHEFQDVMSVFNYRYTDAATITDGAAMLDLFWTRWSAVGGMLDDWHACVTQKLNALETRLQWITPTRFAYAVKTDPAYAEGQVAGDAYPVNTSVAITKRTQNAGRMNIGTLHMPGVPLDSVLNGGITAFGVAKYASLIEEMLKEIVTFGTVAHFSPVLYHKTSPSISPIIVNASLQPFARIERRRTVGLGS